ncbi:MAG: helix-turn-helix transcriptional regulator [Clostridia bacterium]|nr:helix-turn-helix transcriptional regulator [Clostridia bacterium]
MNTREIFGERLGELIAEKATHEGFSKELLANILGVKLVVVYEYLEKKYLPSFEHAILLADCFHCSLNFLFGQSDEYLPQKFTSAKPFSECLKKILQERGLTRYKLKKETSISRKSIDDWFHGVCNPSIDNLIILAEYFDCSMDYLVGREN